MAASLLVVFVDVRVRPGSEDAFQAASIANADASRLESGVVRFDLLQDREEPTHFVLVEIYSDQAAAAAHKQTAHYARWRDAVAELMAEPRRSTKYINVSPEDAAW